MKMMLRRLAIVVCVTLALLSAAYAFAVLRTHSGTGFWKVWLVLAVVFALLAIGIFLKCLTYIQMTRLFQM